MKTVLLSCLLVAVAYAAGPDYSDCAPNGLGHLTNAQITPIPVSLSEAIHVTTDAVFNAADHPSLLGTQLKISLYRKSFLGDIEVCKDGDSILGKGTCTVTDFCKDVIGNDLCTAMNGVASYHVDASFGPLNLGGIISLLASGTYSLKADIYSPDGTTEWGCLQINNLELAK